jgi:hypothetical protein
VRGPSIAGGILRHDSNMVLQHEVMSIILLLLQSLWSICESESARFNLFLTVFEIQNFQQGDYERLLYGYEIQQNAIGYEQTFLWVFFRRNYNAECLERVAIASVFACS